MFLFLPWNPFDFTHVLWESPQKSSNMDIGCWAAEQSMCLQSMWHLSRPFRTVAINSTLPFLASTGSSADAQGKGSQWRTNRGILEVSIFVNSSLYLSPLLFFSKDDGYSQWVLNGPVSAHGIPRKVSSHYFTNRTCKWFETKMHGGVNKSLEHKRSLLQNTQANKYGGKEAQGNEEQCALSSSAHAELVPIECVVPNC